MTIGPKYESDKPDAPLPRWCRALDSDSGDLARWIDLMECQIRDIEVSCRVDGESLGGIESFAFLVLQALKGKFRIPLEAFAVRQASKGDGLPCLVDLAEVAVGIVRSVESTVGAKGQARKREEALVWGPA